MTAMIKRFIGLSAIACLGAAPAVFANETEGTPSQFQAPQQSQLQNPAQLQTPAQGQFQAPAQGQFQAPTQGGQFQAPSQQGQLQTPTQGLSAQQQQQVQKAVAVIVKVPKNQSGQELPLQSQVKLRVSDMAQQGNTDKDLETIWNEETVDVPANVPQDDSSDEANLEFRRFGWGIPFARWGFGARPYFYGYPSFNYYYYPRVGYYPYGYRYGHPYGYRCGYRGARC